MKKVIIAVAALVVVAVVGVGVWLLVGGDGEDTARGTCSDGVTYEFTAEDDDGALEVTFDLRSAAPGEAWVVVLEQGGTSLIEAERPTDEDAELDVEVLADPDGSDEFTATATPQDGGATCTAALAR